MQEEMTQMAPFNSQVRHTCSLHPLAHDDHVFPQTEDETKMKNYTLSPIPSMLAGELKCFIEYRTSTFMAKRSGGAVVSLSAEVHACMNWCLQIPDYSC